MTWKQQLDCKERNDSNTFKKKQRGLCNEAELFCLQKPTTYMCQHMQYTPICTENNHACMYVWRHPSSCKHHTLKAVILNVSRLIFEKECKLSPRMGIKRMPHLSQQYLSTGNKFRFHYTLCKRQSSTWNEIGMTLQWLSDLPDWETGGRKLPGQNDTLWSSPSQDLTGMFYSKWCWFWTTTTTTPYMFWFLTRTEESEKWIGSRCIHGNSLDVETSTTTLKGRID